MKKIFSLGMCFLALLGTSCQNDEENVVSSGETDLFINAQIANSTTRAEKTAWKQGDAIGAFVTDGTLDKPYLGNTSRYKNVNFSHNGKGFIASSIFLNEKPATVYAYYPFSASTTAGTNVSIESSSQTDYLYGVSSSPASISKKNVDIKMNHAMAMLVFKLRKDAAYNEGTGELTKIVVENVSGKNDFKTTGTYNIQTGAVTGTSTNGTITLTPSAGKVILTDQVQSLGQIVMPLSETTGQTVKATFTIDGRQFSFLFPDKTKWSAGFRNNYTLTMKNTGLEIGGGASGTDSGITIETWGDQAASDIDLVPIL